jgi:hypothetical protein
MPCCIAGMGIWIGWVAFHIYHMIHMHWIALICSMKSKEFFQFWGCMPVVWMLDCLSWAVASLTIFKWCKVWSSWNEIAALTAKALSRDGPALNSGPLLIHHLKREHEDSYDMWETLPTAYKLMSATEGRKTQNVTSKGPCKQEEDGVKTCRNMRRCTVMNLHFPTIYGGDQDNRLFDPPLPPSWGDHPSCIIHDALQPARLDKVEKCPNESCFPWVWTQWDVWTVQYWTSTMLDRFI